MNNDRRKRLQSIVSQLQTLREELGEIQREEQDAFDNMPEGLQQSERGQNSEECAGKLESAAIDLDTVISDVEEACE